MPADNLTIPLNRSEHLYWAGEGYLGPINQPYLLRLNQSVDQALVRQTLRELVSAYPRLRAILEPGPAAYRLRVLPDDLYVDQLFDDAFRTEMHAPLDDVTALQNWHSQHLNTPISLERGLPWRARFLPHPEQPGLLFSVHHIIGDGRSMVQMLTAILARLNGQAMTPCPIDSPAMKAAVQPVHWWQWPAVIYKGWRNARADQQATQGQSVITLAKRQSPRFTTSSVVYHPLPCSAEQLKQFAKAKQTTSNTLLTALIANAFLALQPNEPNAVAALRMSLDLRRYYPEGQAPSFGNFVAAFTVRARHQPTLAAQIADIERQVREHMGRFERREHALPLTLYEWLPLIGRGRYSQLIVGSKTKGKLPLLSAHFSNLGNADIINPKEAKIRLQGLWPSTVSTTLLIGALALNGQQWLTLTRQNDEIDLEDVQALLHRIDHGLQNVQ